MGNGSEAVIYEVEGKLVLHDPEAIRLIKAVEKSNCENTLKLNADRIPYFKKRLSERGLTANDAVIVIINVDDVYGHPIADALMPGFNWQEIRDRGEIPFARGLATRKEMENTIEIFDPEAAKKLREKRDVVSIVVVDHGVAEIFEA